MVCPPSFQDIESLTKRLREKELELEHVRSQPDHEKDQEIHRLRSALAEKERCDATRVVLCSSLAEEADQLRGQLGSTVKMCQDLLARLERGKEEGDVARVVAQERNSRAVCVMLGRLRLVIWAFWGLSSYSSSSSSSMCSGIRVEIGRR